MKDKLNRWIKKGGKKCQEPRCPETAILSISSELLFNCRKRRFAFDTKFENHRLVWTTMHATLSMFVSQFDIFRAICLIILINSICVYLRFLGLDNVPCRESNSCRLRCRRFPNIQQIALNEKYLILIFNRYVSFLRKGTEAGIYTNIQSNFKYDLETIVVGWILRPDLRRFWIWNRIMNQIALNV